MQEDVAWIANKCKIICASWKLVLAGGAAIALVGGALVCTLNPPTYTSRTVVQLNSRALGLIKTSAVLDPIIRGETSEPVSERARESLARSIEVSREMGKGTSLYTISVDGQTPQEAQATLEKILQQLTVLSKPSDTRREKIRAEIESLSSTITGLKRLSSTLNKNAEQASVGSQGRTNRSSSAFLMSDIRVQERQLLELRESLEGLHADDVIVRPELPMEPEPQGLLRKLLIVAGAGFLLMGLFVAFRDEWLRGAAKPA